MGMGKISLSYDTDMELIMQPFYFSVSDARAVTASVFVCLWGTGFRFHNTCSTFLYLINYLKTYLCRGMERDRILKNIYTSTERSLNVPFTREAKQKQRHIYKDCKASPTLSFSERRRINETETPCSSGWCLVIRVRKKKIYCNA